MDRLGLFGATATPSLPNASGTWTIKEEMKKKVQTMQRRMMWMIMQTKRKTSKGHAAAHAPSVGRHRRRRTPRPDTTEHNNQDLNEHEESSHDADSNSCFDDITEDNPEDEPTGTLQYQPSKKGYRKQGRPAKRWRDDLSIYSQPDSSNRDDNDLTSDMTWLTTAEDSWKWDAMGK